MLIRRMQQDDAHQAFAVRSAAFHGPGATQFDPDDRDGPDRLVAVDQGEVIGHLCVWPFHQAFGGRGVPMGGVAGVAVAPHRRGAGVGSSLLSAGLDLMQANGQAISTLYPSTTSPYTRWGWAAAGVLLWRTVATRELLDVPEPVEPIDLRPLRSKDIPALAHLHDAVTIDEPGGLVVGQRWFAHQLPPADDRPNLSIVATRAGKPVGFAHVGKKAPSDPHSSFELVVLRLIGTDQDVERALWRQLGSHWSTARTTSLRSQPADPLLFDLPQASFGSGPPNLVFMTRLIDAPAAIAARGWPPIEASVHLSIDDPRRPANSGSFVFEVGDGMAALAPGGRGNVAVDIATLSSMYTGFATPAAMARRGRLPGATDRDVTALGAALVGPTPFLRDYF